MNKIIRRLLFTGLIFGLHPGAQATLLTIDPCTVPTGFTCEVTATPPTEVVADANTDSLTAWDEVQNFTLTSNLYVDSVFDNTVDFVGSDSGGTFLEIGTIVSSHYVAWDPSGTERVIATINTDSPIFAFIFSDTNLFASDAFLGLSGLNYSDFTFRGIEANQDTIAYNGNSADINWFASNPGDWARMITAFSPGGVDPCDDNPGLPECNVTVPEPSILALFAAGLFGLGFARRRMHS